jgi:hypothetical protein
MVASVKQHGSVLPTLLGLATSTGTAQGFPVLCCFEAVKDHVAALWADDRFGFGVIPHHYFGGELLFWRLEIIDADLYS